jgi:hypothetical protein
MERVILGVIWLLSLVASFIGGTEYMGRKSQKEIETLRDEVKATYSYLRKESLEREQVLYNLLKELSDAGVTVDREKLERLKRKLENAS